MSKQVIEPGTYDIEPVELYADEKDGKPFVALKFKVVLKDSADRPMRSMRMYLTERAYGISERALNLMGFNWDLENPACAVSDGLRAYCKHTPSEKGVWENWNLSIPHESRKAPGEPSEQLKGIFAAAREKARANGTKSMARKPPQNATETLEEVVRLNGKSPTDEQWDKAVKFVTERSGKDENFFGPDEWQGVVDRLHPAPF